MPSAVLYFAFHYRSKSKSGCAMNPEAVDVKSIFAEALEKTDAQEQAAYLEGVCGRDTALRAEVESLLISYDQAKRFLPSPDLDQAVTLGSTAFVEGPSTAIGRYKLLEKIGEGGMAVVYMAEQREPIRRQVALKIIKLGMDTRQVIARFEAERQALALLDHPIIAKVFDAGATERGRPYFVMELVHGVSITEYCDKNRLDTRGRLELLVQVCHAVQHAHQKGIIHRDLKPSNVMVTMHDDKPIPKVIDFGIAKAANQRLTEKTVFTRYAHMIGTPAYMSPEQAQMSGLDVDTRTDIYSLGVLLYELLTGTTPFEPQTLQNVGYAEIERIIRETDPPKPSTRLRNLGQERMDVAPRRQTSGEALCKAIRGDLDCIVMKCLEKDRNRRYATAHALADELGRFLERKPILARPVSRPEKAWRWCRRNPVVAALAATLGLVFVLGFAGVTWQGHRASKAAADARRLGNVALGGRYAAQMKLANGAYQAGKIGAALEVLKAQIPQPGAPDFRGFEWRYLYRLCSSGIGEVIATDSGVFQSVAYSPDGHTVVVGTGDGWVEIFGADSRQRVKYWRAHEGAVDYMAYYPQNGNWLATASGDDGTLKLWDIEREQVLFSIDSTKGMWVGFAFSPTGRYLAARATDAQSMNLWELHTRSPDVAPALTLKANLGFFGPAIFSPDERTLALCNKAPGTSALFDLSDDGVVRLLEGAHVDFVIAAAFSSDGNKLVTGGADERVVLWDVLNHVPIGPPYETDLIMVTGVTFSVDGKSLFACGWGPNIRLWNFQKTPESLALQGHGSGVNGMALAPDGRSLASAGRDGTARIWRLAREDFEAAAQPVAPFRTLVRSKDTFSPSLKRTAVWTVAVSPHEDKVVAASDEKLLVIDLLADAEPVCLDVANIFGTRQALFSSARFSPDGSQLVVGSRDGRVAFLDAMTLELTKKPMQLHGSQVWDFDFSLDSRVLITSGGMGTGVKLTEIASGRLIREIRGVEGWYPPQPIAVSPDRTLLATGSPERLVRVWDIASGRLVLSSPQKVRFLHALAFSPDGRLLAYTDESGSIFLWDFAGRRRLKKLVGHSGPVNTLAFSPDGRTLASGGMDHTIRLWHPEIDQEVAILTGHSEWVWCVAFALHGDILLSSGSRDGTLKLWQAASLGEIQADERITRLNP